MCCCGQELDALAEQLNNLGRDTAPLRRTAPGDRREGVNGREGEREEKEEESDEDQGELLAEDGTLPASESSGPQ